MPEANSPATDEALKSAILNGLRASAEIQSRYRGALERQLVAECDSHDGQSREKALEIASQVLADCFAKSPSLLERWRGMENLGAFLRQVASNRLKSFWSSAEKRRVEVNSESNALIDVQTEEQAPGSDEEQEMAAAALRAGVEAATHLCPEGLVFMRLKGLRGIDQRVIANAWNRHEAHVSRRIKEAMEIIRSTACEEGPGDSGGSLDFLRAVQLNPGIFFGSLPVQSSSLGPDLDEKLKMLAAGGIAESARAPLVRKLADDPAALDRFASYLRRQQEPQEMVLRDPVLEGAGARVLQSMRATLADMHPTAAGNLLDSTSRELWKDTLLTIGAEGGSLWFLHPREAVLVAIHNPLEPEFVGTRQPLVSGIISLVLATGESAWVPNAAIDPRHSPAVDAIIGKITHSLLAVPFSMAGRTLGVLTAVRFSRDQPFSEADFALLESRARVLEALIRLNLLTSILDVSHG